MNYVPIILFLVVVVGLLAFSARARRRTAEAEETRRENIQVGSPVMTTSGLYGTVVAINPDDETVQLSIAAGIEVKWAFAALRDAESLPERYAQGASRPAAGPLSQRAPAANLRKERGTS